MIKIIQDYVPAGRRNRPGLPMTPEYVTIHNTGNSSPGADAYMHSKYIKTAKESDGQAILAGWHFTVDDKSIYQHLPLDENGWHATDGYNGTGNRKSIGIEICMHKGINQAQADANAAELVAMLLKQFNLGINRVKQHNHWYPAKNCPAVLRGRPNGWQEFLALVERFMNEEGAEEDMLKTAIVVNSLADVLTVEPLAKKMDAPIFLREACGQLNAETVIVAGGDAKIFERPGVKVIDLSGDDRWKTAEKVGAYYRNLK